MLAEAQRLVLLNAMGVDVYRPRQARSSESALPNVDASSPAATADAGKLVCICERNARDQRLASRLHDILGIAPSRLIWLESSAAGLAAPPQAGAYLVFGKPLARALGEKLSTMQQMQTVIAIVEDAAESMRSATAKRALWQTLKPIARLMRSTVQ